MFIKFPGVKITGSNPRILLSVSLIIVYSVDLINGQGNLAMLAKRLLPQKYASSTRHYHSLINAKHFVDKGNWYQTITELLHSSTEPRFETLPLLYTTISTLQLLNTLDIQSEIHDENLWILTGTDDSSIIRLSSENPARMPLWKI